MKKIPLLCETIGNSHRRGISFMTITEKEVQMFSRFLRSEDRGGGTIDMYLRDVRAFSA